MTHTPTPWFRSGVRFKMNGREWLSINRYDEAIKRDENIAIVGYDPRTNLGMADADYIVHAVNSLPALVKALEERAEWHKCSCPEPCDDYWVFPGGCIGKYREDYRALIALASHKTGGLSDAH